MWQKELLCCIIRWIDTNREDCCHYAVHCAEQMHTIFLKYCAISNCFLMSGFFLYQYNVSYLKSIAPRESCFSHLSPPLHSPSLNIYLVAKCLDTVEKSLRKPREGSQQGDGLWVWRTCPFSWRTFHSRRGFGKPPIKITEKPLPELLPDLHAALVDKFDQASKTPQK